MKIKKLLTTRVIILLIFLFLSLVFINPNPLASGIRISHVEPGSEASSVGFSSGQTVFSVNNKPVNTPSDYNSAILSYVRAPEEIEVVTESGEFTYNISWDFGFRVDENLTVVSSDLGIPVRSGAVVREISSRAILSPDDIKTVLDDIFPAIPLSIQTDAGEFAFLARNAPEISVEEATFTDIKKGLDLQGGARILIKPTALEQDRDVSPQEIDRLKDVIRERLDVFGLSDVTIRDAFDSEGDPLVLVEVAGATREFIRDKVARRAHFEARIGEDVVFEGTPQDIPFVCKGDATCSGIQQCGPTGDYVSCQYYFNVRLGDSALERQARITDSLEINSSQDGGVLSKTLDFYLDEQLVNSLFIQADLKGRKPVQGVTITGNGVGADLRKAQDTAYANMERVQNFLITGSLPLKVEVVKLDSISPILGSQFISNAIFVGILSIFAVGLIVYIRYRDLKIVLIMLFTTLSEVVIILGFAAAIGWRLDLVSIAGIIAAVGTGIDDQIVLIDEVVSGEVSRNWKERVKGAFFIIFTAYATTVAAMIPLWNAGAGLVRGFAIITIVGVSIGVFVTRPAFASLAEKLLQK